MSGADVPMSLGDHLGELRRRMMVPIIVLIVAFGLGFAFQSELKEVFVWPLRHACGIVGPETCRKAGIDPAQGLRMLKCLDLMESMNISVWLALWGSIAVSAPVLLYQLWRFIAVGLLEKERMAGVLFVPAGVACFYLGAVLGYFAGLPYAFAWFIRWAADDPVAVLDLRLEYYRDVFSFFTLVCGILLDVPWLVVVLVRVGLISPADLAGKRKVLILANAVLAALLGPGDVLSMIAIMAILQALFEVGLIAAVIVEWWHGRQKKAGA